MRAKARNSWYFGWNIVAGASFLTLLSVGLRMGIGPFFLPIAEDLGFSRSLLAGIIAVGMLFYGVGMPLAGYLVSIRSTRYVLLWGVILIAGSAVGAVASHSALTFLLSFGIGLSLGLAFISPISMTSIVSRWFTIRRGMALFFLSTGSMAGIAILTPMLNFLIERFGWQATLVGIAGTLSLATVPVALLIMRDDAPVETDTQLASTSEKQKKARRILAVPADTNIRAAVQSRPFWKVAFGLFACGYSMNLLGAHGVPMLMDHGYDAMTGSFGIGLIGVAAIFSTLVLGRLSDMVPRRNILACIYLIRGLGFFALLMVGTHWELYLAATIGGLVWAGSVALSSAILADLYGVRLVGILYGWTYLGHQIGGTFSAWLGGWAYETFGTHWVAFGSAGALLLIASAVSMKLPLPALASLRPVPAGGQ